MRKLIYFVDKKFFFEKNKKGVLKNWDDVLNWILYVYKSIWGYEDLFWIRIWNLRI